MALARYFNELYIHQSPANGILRHIDNIHYVDLITILVAIRLTGRIAQCLVGLWKLFSGDSARCGEKLVNAIF